MSCAVPADFLVYPCVPYPTFKCPEAGLVGRQVENPATPVSGTMRGRTSGKTQERRVERNDHTAAWRMPSGLVLLELQNTVWIIYILECQVFDIAEPEPGIKAENECPAHFRVGIARIWSDEKAHLLHGKDILFQNVVVHLYRYPCTRTPGKHLIAAH